MANGTAPYRRTSKSMRTRSKTNKFDSVSFKEKAQKKAVSTVGGIVARRADCFD
jgi:hypothetical protein